jgi:hypothetical protein
VSGASNKPRVLYGDPNGELVRRKIVVFRRLEPGDVTGPGNHPLRESPYLEGKVLEIALGKSVHDDMVRLSAKRAEVLGAASNLLSSYDLAGMLFSGAGGGLFGVWLDYLPAWSTPYLVGAGVAGIALGFVTRVRKRGAELAANEKWKAAPEHAEYETLAREIAERWIAYSLDVKKETGFHTEVRVAEGSDDPLRLASIDPRGFIGTPPTFDPEDFLPTEGGGVRYEAVHAGGEVVTRLCEGDRDLPESYAKKDAAKNEAEPVRAQESEVEGVAAESETAESDTESEKAPVDA